MLQPLACALCTGWLPRHWQLHVVRHLCGSTCGKLWKLINNVRGPEESEVAGSLNRFCVTIYKLVYTFRILYLKASV